MSWTKIINKIHFLYVTTFLYLQNNSMLRPASIHFSSTFYLNGSIKTWLLDCFFQNFMNINETHDLCIDMMIHIKSKLICFMQPNIFVTKNGCKYKHVECIHPHYSMDAYISNVLRIVKQKFTVNLLCLILYIRMAL